MGDVFDNQASSMNNVKQRMSDLNFWWAFNRRQYRILFRLSSFFQGMNFVRTYWHVPYLLVSWRARAVISMNDVIDYFKHD